jgi:hypothetical protein
VAAARPFSLRSPARISPFGQRPNVATVALCAVLEPVGYLQGETVARRLDSVDGGQGTARPFELQPMSSTAHGPSWTVDPFELGYLARWRPRWRRHVGTGTGRRTEQGRRAIVGLGTAAVDRTWPGVEPCQRGGRRRGRPWRVPGGGGTERRRPSSGLHWKRDCDRWGATPRSPCGKSCGKSRKKLRQGSVAALSRPPPSSLHLPVRTGRDGSGRVRLPERLSVYLSTRPFP